MKRFNTNVDIVNGNVYNEKRKGKKDRCWAATHMHRQNQPNMIKCPDAVIIPQIFSGHNKEEKKMSRNQEMYKKMMEREIGKTFCRYVEKMENQERHTESACQAVEAFVGCSEALFPENKTIQNIMYDKMMDCAVEFEESGFIAGYKTALAIVLHITEE